MRYFVLSLVINNLLYFSGVNKQYLANIYRSFKIYHTNNIETTNYNIVYTSRYSDTTKTEFFLSTRFQVFRPSQNLTSTVYWYVEPAKPVICSHISIVRPKFIANSVYCGESRGTPHKPRTHNQALGTRVGHALYSIGFQYLWRDTQNNNP